MSTYHVLISCPLITDFVDNFADRFAANDIEYDVVDVDQQLTQSDLLNVIDQYHGVLAGDDDFTREVIANAPNLEVISKWGIGTDAIDTEAAEEYNVTVRNTPGAFSNEVANVVIGYAVMLTRKLHDINHAVQRGEWACPRGVSLTDKTFGVVGVGNIGSSVVRRAHAFGMDVLGTDVKEFPKSLVEETGIKRVGRDELLDQSDVVSLNCALTEETEGMIGEEELRRLGGGEGGYLINTARGELIDQDALVTALRDKSIAGAALDVFEQEPLPAEDPLTDLDSVILGSHNAQNTHKAVERTHERAVENLISCLVNEK